MLKNLLMRSKNRTRNVAAPPWRVKLTARETKLSRHLNRVHISAERGRTRDGRLLYKWRLI